MTSKRVWLVCEGETYYNAYIPHGVFTDRGVASAYAQGLLRAVAGQHWPNVYLWEFELDVPGGEPLIIEKEDAADD